MARTLPLVPRVTVGVVGGDVADVVIGVIVEVRVKYRINMEEPNAENTAIIPTTMAL